MQQALFSIRKVSKQKADVHVLEFYYIQISICNSYLEQITAKNMKLDNYQYYDVDGMGNLAEKVRNSQLKYFSA